MKLTDLVVSFADNTQNHHGGIYQAASWNYHGLRKRCVDGLIINGKFNPGRSLNSSYGTRSLIKLRQIHPNWKIEEHFDNGKYLYWKPLSKSGMYKAKRLGLMNIPYPKPKKDIT